MLLASLTPLASTWNVARNVTIFLVVVFWLATAYWVFKDARRRIEDPWLVAMATLLGLVPPFLGPLVYGLFGTDRLKRRRLKHRTPFSAWPSHQSIPASACR